MLDIRQVYKTFNAATPNEVRALRGVTLSIDDGSFVIVIGTNGSGKSTLLNAVAGGFMVDSGTLAIDGTDVTAWPEHRRASFIGRVFQNRQRHRAVVTIAENLALAARAAVRAAGLGRCGARPSMSSAIASAG
jgi:putative ABC transport system ATP-binding protein